jgi:hypothetical protein
MNVVEIATMRESIAVPIAKARNARSFESAASSGVAANTRKRPKCSEIAGTKTNKTDAHALAYIYCQAAPFALY